MKKASQITHDDLQMLLEMAAEQQAQITRLSNEINELIGLIEQTGDILTKLRKALKAVLQSPRYAKAEGMTKQEATHRERITRLRDITK